jgi:ribokinase
MVTVFGSINLDLLFTTARLPSPGETLLAEHMVLMPGGKGANQAVAAARDGAAVIMAGAVGADALGDAALAGLRGAAVDIARVRRVAETTGCASIAIAAGGNQILLAAGANRLARAEQVEDALLTQGALVLAQMETDPAQTVALIGRAAARGARVMLNLAPALPLPRAVLARVHVLVVNEAEAAMLGADLGCDASASGLHRCLGVGVVRTLGAAGAEAATAAGALFVAAEPIGAIDSTAAGDCFIGVLAAALDRGSTLLASMRRASVAASLCCLRHGSQQSLPDAGCIDVALQRKAVSR